MLRVITLNLNGIRSASSKGVYAWLAAQNADVICLQELKAQAPDLSLEMLNPPGLHGYFHYAEKKGYSGVGIYSKRQPDQIIEGLGIADIDVEGRYIEAIYGDLSVVSLYLPSGSSGEERQAAKFAFMERFLPRLEALANSGREFILCGDWNIA
ncbi:MAG: endonuclease/exonuclease/phosphatase family protein, partial [Gammaproteobacteria bacterium]|nr:endonuclease/exonuclease/phosphatase family protein [Gammaproteobacteria bacterium]